MKLNVKLTLILGLVVSTFSFADEVKLIDQQQIINQDPIKEMPDFVPAYYGEVVLKQPKGICVFDIDQTLIAPTAASWPDDKKFPDNDELYKLLPGDQYRIAPYVVVRFMSALSMDMGLA
ncbi:MAG: hypothetical protein K0R14_142 [Burkholderiales bacterium]|nr:hypothetical protein [Burkholderiales bacterium]